MKIKKEAKIKVLKAVKSGKLEPVAKKLSQKSREKTHNTILEYAKSKMTDLAYDESILVYALIDKLKSYIPEDVKSVDYQNGMMEIIKTVIDQSLKVADIKMENRGGIRAIMNQIRIYESIADAMNIDDKDKVVAILYIIWRWSNVGKWKPYSDKNIESNSMPNFVSSRNDLVRLFGEDAIKEVEEVL